MIVIGISVSSSSTSIYIYIYIINNNNNNVLYIIVHSFVWYCISIVYYVVCYYIILYYNVRAQAERGQQHSSRPPAHQAAERELRALPHSEHEAPTRIV